MLRFQGEECPLAHTVSSAEMVQPCMTPACGLCFRSPFFRAARMEKPGPQTALTAWHRSRHQLQSAGSQQSWHPGYFKLKSVSERCNRAVHRELETRGRGFATDILLLEFMSPEGAEAKYTGLQATRQSPCIYSCIPCRKEHQLLLMSLWFEIACQFILIDHKIENMPKHTFHKHFHTNSLSTLQSECYLDKWSESTSLSGLAVCLHRLQTTLHLFMPGRAPARRAICF